MAKTISEEELQLRKRARRRLIGAIALVTMVAVFLPMVLDHEPKPAHQDISIQIPSPTASGTFTSKIVPVAPPASTEAPASSPPQVAAAPARAVESIQPPANDTEASPVKPAPSSTTTQAKSALQPKPATESKATAKPPAKAQTAAAPAAKASGKTAAGAFVVQVAALNDADKARDMQGKISGAGLKSYTEIVPTTKGNVTRVRAGPYATRLEAEKARDKLKELGLSGNVVPK